MCWKLNGRKTWPYTIAIKLNLCVCILRLTAHTHTRLAILQKTRTAHSYFAREATSNGFSLWRVLFSNCFMVYVLICVCVLFFLAHCNTASGRERVMSYCMRYMKHLSFSLWWQNVNLFWFLFSSFALSPSFSFSFFRSYICPHCCCLCCVYCK